MPSVSHDNIEIEVEPTGKAINIRGGNAQAQTRCVKPMVNSGSLNRFTHHDLTPIIGRQFLDLQVKELLKADEQLIKDFAITG